MDFRIKTIAVSALLALAGSVAALDTSELLLCAVTQVHECRDGYGCEAVLHEDVGAPTFLWVDVKKMNLRTNTRSAGSKILNVTRVEDRHVLQGAEDGDPEQSDGGGWTLSIEDQTGRFAAAMVVQQATIGMFGSCTELD